MRGHFGVIGSEHLLRFHPDCHESVCPEVRVDFVVSGRRGAVSCRLRGVFGRPFPFSVGLAAMSTVAAAILIWVLQNLGSNRS